MYIMTVGFTHNTHNLHVHSHEHETWFSKVFFFAFDKNEKWWSEKKVCAKCKPTYTYVLYTVSYIYI